MRNTPTDLQLLEYIYTKYYQEYINYVPEKRQRVERIYVPLDLQRMATHFKVDINILFGRLYYHLDYKYAYKKDDGKRVAFFQNELHGDIYDVADGKHKAHRDVDCINFPYLTAVVANLREERKKYTEAAIIAACSVLISAIALLVSSS